MLSASFDPCSQVVTCQCTSPTLGKGVPLSSTFSPILSRVLWAHGRILLPEHPPSNLTRWCELCSRVVVAL